jgi:DNA adenine methylase
MISWIGGKARMANWINSYIPNDVETYAENFGGMMWCFLKMDIEKFPKLKTVVYNDFNKLNANLFRCTKQYDRLWDELSKYPCQQLNVVDTPVEHSERFKSFQKEVFDPRLIVNDDPNFDLAAKYVFVITQVFSGSKPQTSPFVDYKGKYRSKVLIFMDKLKNPEYRKHFDKITFIEGEDFQKIFEKYDSPTTFFYEDAPYFSTEAYYSAHNFVKSDHERLANCLKKIKGKFAMSYYEFPELLEWFPKDQYHWEHKEFAKASAAAKDKKQTKGTELLIMNY